MPWASLAITQFDVMITYSVLFHYLICQQPINALFRLFARVILKFLQCRRPLNDGCNFPLLTALACGALLYLLTETKHLHYTCIAWLLPLIIAWYHYGTQPYRYDLGIFSSKMTRLFEKDFHKKGYWYW